MLEMFAYRTVTVAHFTDQNWISKIVCYIRCVMVCKIGFKKWNAKIALLHASMVVTYFIKLFRTGADRHSGILMSLLLLVAKTITLCLCIYFAFTKNGHYYMPIYEWYIKLNHVHFNDLDMSFKIYVIGLHNLISINISCNIKYHSFFSYCKETAENK